MRLTGMYNPATARRSGDVFFSFPIGWLYHAIAASDFVLALAWDIQWSCGRFSLIHVVAMQDN